MDELKNAGQEALRSIISGVTQAAEFLKGEIPLAVKELLTYYTALYSIMLVLFLIPVAALLWWCYKAVKLHREATSKPNWRNYNSDQYYDGVEWLFNGLMPQIITLIFLGLALSQGLLPLLKITLAPRIWLIEYASHLIK